MLESDGHKPPVLDLPQFDALESAMARAMRQLEVWRERANASEIERRRLEGIIRKMETVSSNLDATELVAELEGLRAENERLRKRLSEGRHQAEALAREVEFLEDTR